MNFQSLQATKKTLEFKFVDGLEVHVLLPTKAMYDKLIETTETWGKTSEVKQLLDSTFAFVSLILSRNVEQLNITQKYLEENIDLTDVKNIIEEYSKFTNDSLKN
ncbi:MAG: hypothetical protein RR458_04005 [Clostridia bacterium]